MKYQVTFVLFILTIISTACVSLTGCGPLNDPYYSNSGYGNSYGRDDYYYEREREREERRLEREREQLEDEREALRNEQRRQDQARREAEHRQNDVCPSGFHPSEQKCSNEERRHGCKDIRTPSGLGCRNR